MADDALKELFGDDYEKEEQKEREEEAKFNQ